MDRDEIRYLLGSTIFARAKAYCDRVENFDCEVNDNGIRHIQADVRGSGRNRCHTQIWLRANGSFVSASCTCPFNENGEGPACKHIGALLLLEADDDEPAQEKPTEATEKKPGLPSIPGVMKGSEFAREAAARKDSYVSSLEMLFGKKWRDEEPESDHQAQRLIETYQNNAMAEMDSGLETDQPRGFVELEPELNLSALGRPLLRLRIGGGGRQYVVKSIPGLLEEIQKERTVSYGKSLCFVHRWDAFNAEAQALLSLLRRQQSAQESLNAGGMRTTFSGMSGAPAGSELLSGELFDELVAMYEPTGQVGGYQLKKGLPALSLKAEKRRGGVHIQVEPGLHVYSGFQFDYLYSADTLWQVKHAEAERLVPALQELCGSGLFFTTRDAADFCSFVLPELGRKLTIDDPDRLLLNQIPLEPVVQFYLDAPRMGAVLAHAEFLYGEDRVTPFAPAPAGLLRDARAEKRAARLLGAYLQPGAEGNPAQYGIAEDDAVYRLLEEGIPALMAEGEEIGRAHV